MTTERWRHIEALYHEMRARPVHERAAALAAACHGDTALRAEVQSLLDQPESAAGFLATPVFDAASSPVAPGSSRLIGQRIGVFEVQGLLGAGGMGEVYRARDTRLGREVALKLLPRAFKDDPERLSRFEREARVLASLNHPHIGAIYGLEEADGVKALVMELVEGEDLSRRIARGAVPIADALMMARQIAEAVEAAHEQGIVHRDLKPANIKVRQDEMIKVLDFGLAKAVVPPSDHRHRADTIPTEAGVVMGTSAYMSPEQARGEAAGRQSDIWSFGVVLYELLTGASPFARPTTVETLASVIGTQPDYSVLPATTPATVRHLVQRCLEKDRKRRLQHMGDVRIELEDALTALTTGVTPGLPNAVTATGRWQRAATAFGLAVLIGGAAWFVAARSAPQSPVVVRLAIPISSLEPPRTFPYGVRRLAISNDGSRVAYSSASRLWIRRIGQREAVAIDVAGSSSPFFSPDGEWVGFFNLGSGEQGLKKVPARGGTPVSLIATTERPGGAVWQPDGTILFATTAGLYEVSENGGAPRLLAKPDPGRKERAYAWPRVLPGGRAALLTILPEGSLESAQIAAIDLKTLQITTILKGGSDARYQPTGHLVYAAGRGLKAIVFDPDSRQTRGDPVSLPDIDVATAPDNGAAEFDISGTGTLLFVTSNVSSQSLKTLVWVNRRGNEEPLTLPPDRYGYPRISPDGTRVAMDIPGANRDIWIWNLQRSSLTRLSGGPTEDLIPVWARDGQRVFFASDRGGNFDVYSQAADGATEARLEFAAPGAQMPSSLTPDGTRLLVTQDFKDVRILNLAPPVHLDPLLNSEFDEWVGVVSPDGNWVAYESNESGDKVEIFLRPFPNVSGMREKVSVDGGRHPLWGPKGTNELYYIDMNGGMMAASVSLSPRLSLGRVTKLFDWQKPTRTVGGKHFDISPVDGRFLMAKTVSEGAGVAPDIWVVLNWTEELKRLVSTK